MGHIFGHISPQSVSLSNRAVLTPILVHNSKNLLHIIVWSTLSSLYQAGQNRFQIRSSRRVLNPKRFCGLGKRSADLGWNWSLWPHSSCAFDTSEAQGVTYTAQGWTMKFWLSCGHPPSLGLIYNVNLREGSHCLVNPGDKTVCRSDQAEGSLIISVLARGLDKRSADLALSHSRPHDKSFRTLSRCATN